MAADRRRGPIRAPGNDGWLIADLRRETTDELVLALGEQRFGELSAQGDNTDADAAVATALDLIRRVHQSS